MGEDDGLKAMGQVIQIDEARIRDHLGEMVRGTVEETLNALLDAEADRLCGAGRYERSQGRQDTRAGMTYYGFPDIHWQKIRTNNPLERIMKEIRRRTPRGRRLPGRSVLSQPGGRATTLHRRNNVLGQMLHEYAATLSAAAPI
jgi:transposase-like protein